MTEAAPGRLDQALPAERRPPARICLVGTSGYGTKHLAAIRTLESSGAVTLAAGVDPFASADALGPGVPVLERIEQLAELGPVPDVVIVATPISTHADLAAAALRTGADVLLEKPPVADLEQFHRLIALEAVSPGRVQVGFQSLGSHALPIIEEILDSGEIGRLRAVSAIGLWSRPRDYFTRSPWAGRRTLDGVPVVDGVATNPLAHAVVTALRIAGARREEQIASVHTELHRANDIESDDTSVIQIRTVDGIPVTCAFTLCAEVQQDPSVIVEGTEGRLVFAYTRDRLTVTSSRGERVIETGRTGLLDDLIDAGRSGTALLAPLAEAGAFMRVLEAVRTAEDPRPIDVHHISWRTEDGITRAVLPGIEELIERAARAGTGFATLGAPWAPTPPSTGSIRLDAGRELGVHRSGAELPQHIAPRPFLHPVRTIGGTVLSDQQPLDHVWHLGVGVAIQDVDGANVWGGRTYTRADQRYVWRDDHGRVELRDVAESNGMREETLAWLGPDSGVLLHERRRWTHRVLADDVWELGLDTELSPGSGTSVSLGSPGSNGRIGGGYGGFFWRLAPVAEVRAFTAAFEGEDSVHGSTEDWLAISGSFAEGPATLVLRRADDIRDPWFLRLAGYPGVGLSLAWDDRVIATTTEPIARSVRVLIVDGLLGAEEVDALLTRARGSAARGCGTPEHG